MPRRMYDILQRRWSAQVSEARRLGKPIPPAPTMEDVRDAAERITKTKRKGKKLNEDKR